MADKMFYPKKIFAKVFFGFNTMEFYLGILFNLSLEKSKTFQSFIQLKMFEFKKKT